MLDPKIVLQDPAAAAARWSRRGLDGEALVAELLGLDARRRAAIRAYDDAKVRQNELSEIFKRKDVSAADKAKAREDLRPLSDAIAGFAATQKEADEAIFAFLANLPNWPQASVPDGKNEHDNVLVRTWGEPPKFDFTPKDHVTLGEALGILDFEAAGRISGARFAVYRGAGARLERALQSFMLDLHTEKHGYTEVFTPFLVARHTMVGTGQLPKFEEDAFRTTDDLFLIPTSEVTVTNLHREQILSGDDLPIHYTAWSSCFRREAGSYGRDVKGLTRLHQFQKVELVKLTTPETSSDELEAMVRNACAVLEALGLHYRVMLLCAGDMGFGSAKTYDIEVWLPGQNQFREISSCSNCEDFQARRAEIRYRPGPQEKVRHVHTLNGSGLAIGRTIVAILENFQNADGTIRIPRALRPYMGGAESIPR
jgi:seryl-tRNA synthetase